MCHIYVYHCEIHDINYAQNVTFALKVFGCIQNIPQFQDSKDKHAHNMVKFLIANRITPSRSITPSSCITPPRSTCTNNSAGLLGRVIGVFSCFLSTKNIYNELRSHSCLNRGVTSFFCCLLFYISSHSETTNCWFLATRSLKNFHFFSDSKRNNDERLWSSLSTLNNCSFISGSKSKVC